MFENFNGCILGYHFVDPRHAVLHCKCCCNYIYNAFTGHLNDGGSDSPAIVIDNSSSEIIVGFGGDDAPMAVFPSVVGRPKSQQRTVLKRFYVGDETEKWYSMLSLEYPIQRGVIKNWDDLEMVSDL